MLDQGAVFTSVACVDRILRSQPEFRALLVPDYIDRIIVPAFDTGQFALLCGGRAYMTWFRPTSFPQDVPSPKDFQQKGPIVWLIDVVAEPGVAAMRLGREIARVLYDKAELPDGERVLFYRWPSARIGYIRARRAA